MCVCALGASLSGRDGRRRSFGQRLDGERERETCPAQKLTLTASFAWRLRRRRHRIRMGSLLYGGGDGGGGMHAIR